MIRNVQGDLVLFKLNLKVRTKSSRQGSVSLIHMLQIYEVGMVRLHNYTSKIAPLANLVAQLKIMCDSEVQLTLTQYLVEIEEFGTVGMLQRLLRLLRSFTILGHLLSDCNNGELGERNAAIGAVWSEHPSVKGLEIVGKLWLGTFGNGKAKAGTLGSISNNSAVLEL